MSSHNPNLDQPVEPTESAEARMRLALGLGTRPVNSGAPSATSGPPPASHDSVRQRRRFAQDGDVPVVMLHRGRDAEAGGENKLAGVTADLREERAARLKAERALDEANLLVSSLKTKLKHAEMTLEEKRISESEARGQVDALLLTEREARQHAEAMAAEAALALSMLERKIETASKSTPIQPTAVESAPIVAAPELSDDPDIFAPPPVTPKQRMSKKAASAAPEPRTITTVAEPERAVQIVDGDEEKPIEWWLPSFRAARKTPIRRKRATS